jgi:hypothetical protein
LTSFFKQRKRRQVIESSEGKGQVKSQVASTGFDKIPWDCGKVGTAGGHLPVWLVIGS